MKIIPPYRAILVIAALAPATLFAAETIVQLDAGRIEGLLAGEKHDVRVFKGIPFAAPPVGNNRWREPQPVEAWSGLRACKEFSAACPQSDALVRLYGAPQSKLSEDCLYLNVYTPATDARAELPVMVWFYGGAFALGDAATYDMERLSRLGAVIVTVNYRVGVFGFLAHGALTKESPHHISGNYGLHDMVAALRWVQRNIAAFGGTARNVTIFGQSAGASGVCYLMASPQTTGLFHRAISESNGAYPLDPTLAMAEQTGAKFFAALGCDGAPDALAAARAKPWQEVFDLCQSIGADGQKLAADSREARMRFWPNIDRWLLPDATSEVFAAGHEQNVPLLIGSNADESDLQFTSGARYFAAKHSQVNRDVYRYFFTQKSKDPLFAGKGAVHAAEIAYVLRGNARLTKLFDAQDWALSDVISSAWVQFARTGNPNLAGQPFTWPRYDAATDPYLELGVEIKPGSRLRPAICDGIDTRIASDVAKRRAAKP
jgi:para-nitrobenzyl esterase